MLTRIQFDKFTAFENLDVKFSPGINVFIGENGTGKTHILKAAYAACDFTVTGTSFALKLNNVFYPSGKKIGRLVNRIKGSRECKMEVSRIEDDNEAMSISIRFTNHTTLPDKATVSGKVKAWQTKQLNTVYIPVKDMMANAPGFKSLYEKREIHFEEIYADIISKAFLPVIKGPMDRTRKRLIAMLQHAMEGTVTTRNEEFFMMGRDGTIEFTLLAEGYRKLGLLWLLIRNETLQSGSILFWDEPEANLNPRLLKAVVEILLELQRIGVQIFIATHDYVLLKELDLQMQKNVDNILFHSLFRESEGGKIMISSTSDYAKIAHNAIDMAYEDIIDREIDSVVLEKSHR